jgi:hypothetical protein
MAFDYLTIEMEDDNIAKAVNEFRVAPVHGIDFDDMVNVVSRLVSFLTDDPDGLFPEFVTVDAYLG